MKCNCLAPLHLKGLRPVRLNVFISRLLGDEELQKVVQETRVIVDQLTPFTNYTFYVRAYNARSTSLESAEVTQMTEEDG